MNIQYSIFVIQYSLHFKRQCLFSVLFTLCCLLLLTSSAFSADSQLSIGSIRIDGNVSISRAQILSKVRSRVGDLFDEEMVKEDAKRIAGLPGVERSYYNTAVFENGIQLTFVVVERNIVRSIDFIGNRKVKAKVLQRKLGFKVGDYLDPILAEAYRRTLTEFYRKKGHAFVEVALDGERLSAGRVVYTIGEGPRVEIESVRFSGNSVIRTGPLKKAIKTDDKRWFLWPRRYVEMGPAEDVARLQNIYQKRGFLDAEVTLKRQFNARKNRVRITFVIDEGPVYVVERIVVTGNEHFNEKRLWAELKLERRQIYSERKAGSDAKRLIKHYRENGFVDVKVEQRREFAEAQGKVNVVFDITEGERFRIGRINITGNEQTQDKVIRRVLDEYDFQPGRWYNADMARGDGSGELERMVRRMALAESSTITPGGETPGQRSAEVSVVEGQTGMVMIGAGVSSDSGIIGQFVFEQRNFDISDWPESFGEFITGKAFRGAGQSLRIALQPGTEVSEYSVSFVEPYFKDKPISLNVIGSSYGRVLECYDEDRTKGYVGFEKRYKNRWRRSVGFRVEDVDVDDIDSDAPNEIKDVEGGNVIGGVRFGVGRDLTDDRFNPSKGYSFNASYEQVAGDHTFGILSGTGRWYRTVYEDLAERRTILATKLHAATVLGDAPPFEKFYAGGSRSIRGFDYRGVSTRGGVGKDPIGSDWIFLANAEITVPLVSDNFSALFFIDSGAIDSGNYRAAVGTGIQILIPQWFGPVPMRFEIATPLMKGDEDETQVFSFSMGRLF